MLAGLCLRAGRCLFASCRRDGGILERSDLTLRPLVLLAALVAAATSTGALAMDGIAGPATRPAPDGAYQVAQDSNYEIFYDGRGNRVVLDDRTGRVISVEPPQSRLDRRALRRRRLGIFITINGLRRRWIIALRKGGRRRQNQRSGEINERTRHHISPHEMRRSYTKSKR